MLLYTNVILMILIHAKFHSVQALFYKDDYFNHGQYALPEFIIHRKLVTTKSTTETTTILPWLTLTTTKPSATTRKKKTTTPLDIGEAKFFVIGESNSSAILTIEDMATTIPTTTVAPYLTGYVTRRDSQTIKFTTSLQSTVPEYPSEPIQPEYIAQNINHEFTITDIPTTQTYSTMYYFPPKTTSVNSSSVIPENMTTDNATANYTTAETVPTEFEINATTMQIITRGIDDDATFVDLTNIKRIMRIDAPHPNETHKSVLNATQSTTTENSSLKVNATVTESTTTIANTGLSERSENIESIAFSFTQTTTAKYEEVIEYEELTTQPFSKYLELLLQRLAKMEDKYVRMFLNRLGRQIVYLVNYGRFDHFGPVTKMYIQDSETMIESPIDVLKRCLAMSYNAMAHRRKVVSDELNSLLDFVDMVFTASEEEKMERMLNETIAYPNTPKTHQEIVDEFLNNVVLHPSLRLSGTNNGKILFDSITNLIIARHPLYSVRRHAKDTSNNYLQLMRRKLMIAKAKNKEFTRKYKKGRLKLSNRRNNMEVIHKTKRLNGGFVAKYRASKRTYTAAYKKTNNFFNRQWGRTHYKTVPNIIDKNTKIKINGEEIKSRNINDSNLQSKGKEILYVTTEYRQSDKFDKTNDKYIYKKDNQKGRYMDPNIIRQRVEYTRNFNNFVSQYQIVNSNPILPENKLSFSGRFDLLNQQKKYNEKAFDNRQSTIMLQPFYKQIPQAVYRPMEVTNAFQGYETKTIGGIGNNIEIHKYVVTNPNDPVNYVNFAPAPVDKKPEDRHFISLELGNIHNVLDFNMKLQFQKPVRRPLIERQNTAMVGFQPIIPETPASIPQTISNYELRTWSPYKIDKYFENNKVAVTVSNTNAATPTNGIANDMLLADLYTGFDKIADLKLEESDESKSIETSQIRMKDQQTHFRKYEKKYNKRKRGKHKHKRQKHGRHDFFKRTKGNLRAYNRKKKHDRKRHKRKMKRYKHHRLSKMKFEMGFSKRQRENNKKRYNVITDTDTEVVRYKNKVHRRPFINSARNERYSRKFSKNNVSNTFINSAQRVEKYKWNIPRKFGNKISNNKKVREFKKKQHNSNMIPTWNIPLYSKHSKKVNEHYEKITTRKINQSYRNKMDSKASDISVENPIKQYKSDNLQTPYQYKGIKINKGRHSKHFPNSVKQKILKDYLSDEELQKNEPPIQNKINELLGDDDFANSDQANKVIETNDEYIKYNSPKQIETVNEYLVGVSTLSHKANELDENPLKSLGADNDYKANHENMMMAYSDQDNFRRNLPVKADKRHTLRNGVDLLKDSLYSDDEKELRNNLYDAFRHEDTRNFRRNTKHNLTQKLGLRDESEYTDMESVLKKKVYKAIKKMI